MTIQNFKRSSGGHGLYLPDDDQADMVFLLPPDSETPPELISLSESWDNFPEGCYVFLPDSLPESNQGAFAVAAWNFLSEPTRHKRHRPDVTLHHIGPHFSPRFAWFANPEQAEFGLRGQSISLYQYQDEEHTTPEWRNDRLVICNFDDYTLEIVKNCAITLKEDGSGFTFSPSKGYQNTFLTPQGWLNVDIYLSIGGPDSGAFILSAEDIVDFIHKLQPEIRYFFKDERLESTSRNYSIASQSYPILSQDVDDWIGMSGGAKDFLSLHLLKPMVSRGIDLFIPFKGVRMPSCFRTNLGHLINLTPLEGSRLVFVSRPGYSRDETGHLNHYTTLQGDFEISVTKDSSVPDSLPDNLICGLSGAEYIDLPGNKQNILTFIPGQAAFAPNFSFDQTQGGDTGDGEKLTAKATTAWVYIYQRDRESASTGSALSYPIYYAQPDQAVLYEPFKDGNSDTGNFLDFMEIPATALPAERGENSPILAFPLAPYARVEREQIENYQKFETGLLNPFRRTLIDQITTDATSLPLLPEGTELPEDGKDTKRKGTTPQGLVAEYSGDYQTIRKLTLAEYNIEVINDDSDSQEASEENSNSQKTIQKNLDFREIERTDPLRAALQSSQLFLVISDPESIKKHFKNEDDQSTNLEIAGWKFDLDPKQWEKRQTLLIFKYHNQSLEELAASTQAWTLADKFNANPENARFRLDKIIQDALAFSPIDPNDSPTPQAYENYRQLAFAARTPGWTGILALNVTIPQGGLPTEIAGLASGIDQEQFFSQYVGIESSTVKVKGGDLDIESSSLFGLIDYNDPAGTASYGRGDY
ncbi:MAG: hypothetical protein WBL25_03365, partial [Anaerolineales bacterium]